MSTERRKERIKIAAMMMQGIVSNEDALSRLQKQARDEGGDPIDYISEKSLQATDSLIARLDRE